jgi:predicted lipoprotein with Yx(FWY)xxD motif
MHEIQFRTRGPRRSKERSVSIGALLAVTLALLVLSVSAEAATTSRSSARVVISTVKNARFGTILVSGHTVYTLKPSAVKCTATCLRYWPAVLLPKGVAKATAGRGVNPAKLGSVRRAGGVRQVTYGGRALYWFARDTAPGQVKGNVTDTWGKWSVVVTKRLSTPVTTTTAAGGGGGGVGF